MHEPIDYESIDPGIRDLCRIINKNTPFRTISSCEGHIPLDTTENGKGELAFVIFDMGHDASVENYERLHSQDDRKEFTGKETVSSYRIAPTLYAPHLCGEHIWVRPAGFEARLLGRVSSYTDDDKRTINRHFIRHLEEVFGTIEPRKAYSPL